jgi:ribonuclease HI
MDIYCDGSSSTASGISSHACWKVVVVHDVDATETLSGYGFGLSNEAEAKAVLTALYWIYFGYKHVGNFVVKTDSKQLYNQVVGTWSCRGRIKQLVDVIKDMINVISDSGSTVSLHRVKSADNMAHCNVWGEHPEPSVDNGIEYLWAECTRVIANYKESTAEDNDDYVNSVDGLPHDLNEWEPA